MPQRPQKNLSPPVFTVTEAEAAGVAKHMRNSRYADATAGERLDEWPLAFDRFDVPDVIETARLERVDQSGKVAEVPGNSTAEGAALDQRTAATNADNQLWQMGVAK